MNIDKLYWKSIYYWIKYFNYKLEHTDKNTNEIWLSNKKKEELIVFRKEVSSTQEIRFDKSKINDHKENLQKKLGFKIKKVEFFYFLETSMNIDNFDEMHPTKLIYHSITNEKDLENTMPNFILKKRINKKEKKSSLDYKKRVLNTNLVDKYMMMFSPMTYTLIAINVLVWLYMKIYLNHFSDIKLLDVGGLVHFNVVHGEWYRLITSMFLHFNFEHILMNMLSLFIFGKIVETIVGPYKMLGIYLISGLFGNFASLSFNISTISVGASGAIFGLIGAILTMMYLSKTFNKKMIIQLLVVVLILIFVSLFMSNINLMAHLGGFIGGILMTLIGYYFHENRNLFWLFLILLLVLFVLLQIRIFSIKEENIYDKLIKDEMISYNYDDALSIVEHTINKGYDDDETYYLKGLITATKSSKAEAMADWERGLRSHPNSALLNYELSIANRALNDNDKSLKYIKKALKIDANNQSYKNLEKELKDSNESKN